jgi:hypothetical protein
MAPGPASRYLETGTTDRNADPAASLTSTITTIHTESLIDERS